MDSRDPLPLVGGETDALPETPADSVAANPSDPLAAPASAREAPQPPGDDAAYQRARHLARAGLRAELVELADQRLQQEGPGALSMRRLANAAGCSTMVLYSTFGDKGGLLAELARREAERWIDAVTMFADPDPVAWFDAAAAALWSAAGDRPHHRSLLFDPKHGVEAVAKLRSALLEAIDQSAPGALEDGVAEAVWSAWAGALAGYQAARTDGPANDSSRFAEVQRGLAALWRAYVAA
jgi:AcrR family transcriptional regulator